MFSSQLTDKRALIPRWRASTKTSHSFEAKNIKNRRSVNEIESWFDEAVRDYRNNPTPGSLADAFSAALAEDRVEEATVLANAVQDFEDRMSPLAQKVATELIEKKSPNQSSRFDLLRVHSIGDYRPEIVHRFISRQKRLMQFNDRNPLYWSDLAFAFNLLGQQPQAEKAMIVAVSLSDNHRAILRGAARFFVHWDDIGAALSCIQRSQDLKTDPWLISAHVSISQFANRKSNLLGSAKRILRNIPEISVHYSELGMSMATQDFFEGHIKGSRVLANRSLGSATENALAQGVWLSNMIDTPFSGLESRLPQIEAYEASAWEAYYSQDWTKSLEFTMQWLLDQPFSVAPAMHGSFVAATFEQDFELASGLAKFGLAHNKKEWGLRNNLVVSLCAEGKDAEARLEHEKLAKPTEDSSNYPTWLATSGLIEYKLGNIETARSLYEQSREILTNKNKSFPLLLTALFQCREELLLGELEYSTNILKQIRDDNLIKKTKAEPIFDALLLEIEKVNAIQPETAPTLGLSKQD